MTAAREKIIEAMARAWCAACIRIEHQVAGVETREDDLAVNVDMGWREFVGPVTSSLAAIAEQRYAIVPREATEDMSKRGGETEGMKVVNAYVINAQVRTGALAKFPGEGYPLQQAYRAMVASADS